MAELALGLTKTVVEGALTRIQAAIEEEKKLKDGVQEDLVFITGEFQMMQSFLKVANRERARKNEVVRTWIRQLRDLAFDVENWVEFVAHMDPHESTAWSSLWRAAPSWVVPRCCLAPPRHLDEAAAEMKMLKARVEDVSRRNTRYSLFGTDDDDTKKATAATAAANIYNPSYTAFQILRQLWVNEVDRLRKVDLVDRHSSCLKPLLIVPDVVPDADLEVIWLWGGDDRGMSNLINTTYHDPDTSDWFHHRAWVKITRPFKHEELWKTLEDQLVLPKGVSICFTNDTECSIQPAEMNEERYLVVVEDVSDLVELNSIRRFMAFKGNKGTRIVVSTQNFLLPITYAGRTNAARTTYLVSEIVPSLEGRPSICAFYKKVAQRYCDTDRAKLKEKMRPNGIISVYDDDIDKSTSILVKTLYHQICMNDGYCGVERFWHIRWVPVVGGQQEALNLMDLSRRMHLPMDHYGFYDGDLHELLDIFGGSELGRVLGMTEEDVIQESLKHLKDCNCLVVIHGLRSRDDWDVIKSKFLSPVPHGCCFVVVTDDKDVASYCVDGNEERLVRARDTYVGMGRMLPYKREEAIASLTSIYDRTSNNQRQEQYDQMISNCILTEKDNQHVVSVVGMAGVGKSAMVKWSYSKKMLDPENTIFDFTYYCWVEVPHPFNLEELSWHLLLGLLSDYAEHMEQAMINIIDERRDIVLECQTWLVNLLLGGIEERSPLMIVLDGVRSTEDWDAVNTAFCLSDPRYLIFTIVITDDQSVAMHCVNNNNQKMVNVLCLETDDDALRLFHRQIDYYNMDASEGKDDVRVKGLSERIMARCGGLPKVIAAVAECYNNSLKTGMYLKLKDINDNFMHILEGDHSLSGLFSWMKSYLETCKDDIKPCIFYLPVFLGQNVRFRRLIRRWTAEGYVRDTSSHTAEENGLRLLIELLGFSMIQLQPSTKPVQFQVNGFLHEYITSRPLEDNLVLSLEGPCSLNASQRAGSPGQHLTVRNMSDMDKAAFRSVDFSRLRSLTVFGECKPFMFDPAEIKMRYVRVLDLEDASGVKNDYLEHVVEVFPRLKFLSIRGCREITSLPKSLGGLRQLQTLDVRDTSISTLPEVILELHKLQYVRAGTRLSSKPWDEGGSMVPCKPTAPEEEDHPTTVAEDALSAPAEDATTVAVAAAPPLVSAQSPTTFPLLRAAATTVSPAPAQDSSTATSSRRHPLTIPSWLSKLCCRRSRIDSNAGNPGVEVPAGIGKLTTLQTFGVAIVGTGRKAVILKELPDLTELRRLAVCGINPDNVRDFFSAIKGLPHLKQLSVTLDKNNKDGHFACLDGTIEQPPKSLDEHLKLHGHVRILVGSWLKKFATVGQLDLEVTLQQEEDMQIILDQLLHHKDRVWKSCLCLKPIYDGKLSVGVIDEEGRPRPIELHISILEIDCTSKLEATIVGYMPYVYVVKVHCSSGSSLQLSGLQQIGNLKEVWLKGPFSDDSLKKDLQRQLAQHQNKPVLKVFQPLND